MLKTRFLWSKEQALDAENQILMEQIAQNQAKKKMTTSMASSYQKLPSDNSIQTTPTKMDSNAANIPNYGDLADYSGP